MTTLVIPFFLCGLTSAYFNPNRVNHPIIEFELAPLQWGSVSPLGWLRDWAEAERNGTASPARAWFVTHSDYEGKTVDGWRNGRPTTDGFWGEDTAYWIDGMTRLALVLKDKELLARVKEDFEAVMANPYWFHNTYPGDRVEGWVRNLYARGMLAYYDGTGDSRILNFLGNAFSNYTAADSVLGTGGQVERSITQLETLLETHAFGGNEALVQIGLSLVGRSPDAGSAVVRGQEFMETLLSGCTNNETLISSGQCAQATHGVAFLEIAKLFAIAYAWNGNETFLTASVNAFDMVSRYDLAVHGVNTGDECLNGIGPNAATETCDIVDFSYANQWMLRVTGQATYADRIEKAMYNAAPASVNRDFTEHVYFQSPNYVSRPTNESTANVTGFLRPSKKENVTDKFKMSDIHYPPCCTGNHVRMLPNFIHHMYAEAHGGLAIIFYGPSSAFIPMPGGNVTLMQITDYPFKHTVSLSVEVSGGTGQLTFPLWLRIPSWCEQPSIAIDGEEIFPKSQTSGFAKMERIWAGRTVLLIHFPAMIRAQTLTTFSNGAPFVKNNETPVAGTEVIAETPYCSIELGPLAFALPLENDPSKYKYAIDCESAQMQIISNVMPPHFDWPLVAPIRILAMAQELDDWEDAQVLPSFSIPPQKSKRTQVELVPYGSTKQFRVSMFPTIANWSPDRLNLIGRHSGTLQGGQEVSGVIRNRLRNFGGDFW